MLPPSSACSQPRNGNTIDFLGVDLVIFDLKSVALLCIDLQTELWLTIDPFHASFCHFVRHLRFWGPTNIRFGNLISFFFTQNTIADKMRPSAPSYHLLDHEIITDFRLT